MFGSWLRSSDKSGKPKKTHDSLLLPFNRKREKLGLCLGQIHKRVEDNGESNCERERERERERTMLEMKERRETFKMRDK